MPTIAYPLLIVTVEGDKSDRTIEKRLAKIDKGAWQRLAQKENMYIVLGAMGKDALLAEAGKRGAIDSKQVGFVTSVTSVEGKPEEVWAGRKELPIKPVPTTLHVEFTGVRPRRSGQAKNGTIQGALFDTATGFPGDAKSARDAQIIALPTETLKNGATALNPVMTFTNLNPGFYAVVVFHDEDENGKMGTSFGVPTEGYGSSNDPSAYRAPRFDECRFLITGATDTRQIVIKMNYF
jgi:uncharacterized protein (DUF2141 family)